MYCAWFYCMPWHIWQLPKGRRSFVKRTTKLEGRVVSLVEYTTPCSLFLPLLPHGVSASCFLLPSGWTEKYPSLCTYASNACRYLVKTGTRSIPNIEGWKIAFSFPGTPTRHTALQNNPKARACWRQDCQRMFLIALIKYWIWLSVCVLGSDPSPTFGRRCQKRVPDGREWVWKSCEILKCRLDITGNSLIILHPDSKVHIPDKNQWGWGAQWVFESWPTRSISDLGCLCPLIPLPGFSWRLWHNGRLSTCRSACSCLVLGGHIHIRIRERCRVQKITSNARIEFFFWVSFHYSRASE